MILQTPNLKVDHDSRVESLMAFLFGVSHIVPPAVGRNDSFLPSVSYQTPITTGVVKKTYLAHQGHTVKIITPTIFSRHH